MKPDINFEHLAGAIEFAEFTKLLKKLTGLVMSLNSPEGICRGTFRPKGGSPICCLIRGSSKGFRRCIKCDRRYFKKVVQNSKPQLYTCHAGLLDMAVPVFVQGRHIATISSGQILPEPPSETGFTRLLKRISWLDRPESVLKRSYFESPYLPREKIRYVMKLLELFAWQLCDSLQKIKELEARLERDEIRRAKEFIAGHFHNPSLGRSDVATHVCLSPAHFSHVFKQESGISFVKAVQAKRVNEAKRFMTGTGRSITEICFSCGFNSMTNFNRVFRNIEHCSPSQFRKKLVKDSPFIRKKKFS